MDKSLEISEINCKSFNETISKIKLLNLTGTCEVTFEYTTRGDNFSFKIRDILEHILWLSLNRFENSSSGGAYAIVTFKMDRTKVKMSMEMWTNGIICTTIL